MDDPLRYISMICPSRPDYTNKASDQAELPLIARSFNATQTKLFILIALLTEYIMNQVSESSVVGLIPAS